MADPAVEEAAAPPDAPVTPSGSSPILTLELQLPPEPAYRAMGGEASPSSPPVLPGVCSPLRRHLKGMALFRKSVTACSFNDLLDTPQAVLSIVSWLGVGDIGRLMRTCNAVKAFCASTDDVWKVCWGRPWVQGYVADMGARSAVEWYGSHKRGLQAELMYQHKPVCVPFSSILPALPAGAGEGPDDSVCCVLVGPDPLLVLGLATGEVRVHRAGSFTSFTLAYGSIRHVMRRGHLLFVASWNGAVHTYNMITRLVSLLLHDLPSPVFGLHICGSQLMSCSGNGRLCVYNLYTHSRQGRVPLDASSPRDADVLATLTQELVGHTGSVTDVFVTRLMLVSGSMDRTVRVWRRSGTGEYVCAHILGAPGSEGAHPGPVWSLQVLGEYVFSGASDGTVRVWSGMSGELIHSVRVCPGKQVWCLCVVGNFMFVGASDGTVSCWCPSLHRKNWSFRGPADGVRRLAVTSNHLITLSKHGRLSAYAFGVDAEPEADDAVFWRLRCV